MLFLTALGILQLLYVRFTAAALPTISDLHQVAGTANSITVQWSIDPSTPVPQKYTLLICSNRMGGCLTREFFPPNPLEHYVDGLLACNDYNISLSATFEEGVTEPETSIANTEYEAPGIVEDIRVDGENLVWSVPSNPDCVAYYEICWTSTNCVNSTTVSTPTPTAAGCELLSVTVTAFSPNGEKGPPASTEVTTAYGPPGPPTNFEVIPLPNFGAELHWDNPEVNPACVERYSIVYGECENATEVVEHPNIARSDNSATLANLSACTCYEFDVISVGENDESIPATEYLDTDYTAPTAIPNLQLDPDTTSIEVQWDKGLQDACLQYIEICYSDTVTMDYQCKNITNPDAVQNHTITGLTPCRTYDFLVIGVSVNNEYGPPSTSSTTTLEVAPGEVQDLTVTSVGENTITVRYGSPIENPDCAAEYVISDTLLTTKHHMKRQARAGDEFEDVLNGLEACAEYEITVYAQTVSGLTGPESSVTSSTQDIEPEPPQQAQVVDVTTTTITFLWFAPNDRFCVDYYEVSYDDELDKVEVGSQQEVLHQVINLTPCTNYDFQIKSVNELGTSSSFRLDNCETIC